MYKPQFNIERLKIIKTQLYQNDWPDQYVIKLKDSALGRVASLHANRYKLEFDSPNG